MTSNGTKPPDPAVLAQAALEAAGIAFEVRADDGAVAYANDLARRCFAASSIDAPDREEAELDGRALGVERRRFALDGSGYRVSVGFDIEEQRRLQDELFQLAYFDPLTGLPNREFCERAIGDLIRTGTPEHPFAVALVHIDKFSQINAFHGSAVGDELLARIAERLAQGLGPEALLARTSGDEFSILLPCPDDPDAVLSRVEQMLARVADPYFVDGSEIFASGLAGVSLWPRDDSTPEGLRQKAKAALAETKRSSGGSARRFQPAMERAELGRARLEMSLRSAIRDRRISCAFQPKFDFRAGIVDSLEVLMRWRDENGEWRSPGEFLNLAHKVGLTNDITQLVFEETLASLDAIGAAFRPGLPLGFNISAKQAGDTRFMRGFAQTLATSGEAHRFVVEITEEAFLPASQFQSRVLPMLREIGAKISIDDFGAGYSSLATLADITADEVKVDRSLIVDIDKRPRSQSLLRAIESIGVALGTEVMVEGVETPEELAYLSECTQIRVAQGYYLSKPMMLCEVTGGADERILAPRGLAERSAPARGRPQSRVVEPRLV